MKKIVLGVLLLLWAFSTTVNAGAETVRAGYTSRDLNYLPFFIAQKRFHPKEGLQVELVSIGRSDVQLQALVTGDLHFANINPDGIIIWNERSGSGGGLKVAAGSSNAAPYLLIGAKNIKRVEDLKGQRVGVASLRGGATSILLSYLKNKGLIYPRDFSMVVIAGGTPARLSALESGSIAGAVLGIPFGDIAVDKGFPALGDTMEVIPTYQFNAININPTWAEKNRSSVVKFIKGHIQALRWIYERPGEAAEFLNKELGLQAPYARRGIDYYVKNKVYAVNGEVTLSGLKVNIEVQAQDGVLKEPLPPPERYTDLTYLRQAQKELGL
jgi:ABC-type nitrate/sulfonate/bicarbonate transport system substrate-binding protein